MSDLPSTTAVGLCLTAAVVYATGALVIKRSADLGVGVWRTAFVANVLGGLLFQPLLLLGGTLHADLWWQPLTAGTIFVVGQGLTFLSLDRGDVSVATPVLGLKIILVAMVLTLLGGEHHPGRLWLAACLATAGVALLNRRPAAGAHQAVGRTVLTAGSAAACYAVFDVLIQRWSPHWGVGRFLPLALGWSGLLSCLFITRFRAPLSAVPRPAWPWLIGGSLLLAGQSVLFVSTLARWGHAASSNVIYSSRGLWSVALVWLLGRWVKSREQAHGRLLAWRLAGAALMMSAIALVAA